MFEEVCIRKLTASSGSFLRRLSQDGSGVGATPDEGKQSKKQEKRGKGRRDRRAEKEEEGEESQRAIPFMSRSQVANDLYCH